MITFLKQHRLKVLFSLLGAMICFMLVSVITLKAQQAAMNFYDNPDFSLEDVMTEYHKYMNDSFNRYTKLMLQKIQKNPDDADGKPLDTEEACLNNPNNYSTYCVAITLLGDDTKPALKGYLNYKKALQTRRNTIFANEADENLFIKHLKSSYAVTDMLASLPVTKYIFDKNVNIDREIASAKDALDKTLAAYDQLRMAYPMHIQYVNIFNALVNYRDKLVEVRHQTDQYPARFTDVTTAKCT